MFKCVFYCVAGVGMFASPGCFAGHDVIVPHRVVHTSHLPPVVYRHYPQRRHVHRTHVRRHNHGHHGVHNHHHRINRRYKSRVRYHNRVRPSHKRTLRKRVVTRRYNKNGNLRKRTTRRTYRNNRY